MGFFVYLITNKVNGKKYVGKTNNPRARWRAHCGTATRGGPAVKIVHKAIAKYGVENFSFEVIGEYATEQESLDAEMVAIVAHNSRAHGYNMTDGGDGVSGLIYTEEVRARMSASHMGKVSGRKGTPTSDETRARMRDSHLGKTLPEEHKRKIGASSIGHAVSSGARESISSGVRASWADPTIRAIRLERMKRRLTENEARAIKVALAAATQTMAAIARDFGVSARTVHLIARGSSWSHL